MISFGFFFYKCETLMMLLIPIFFFGRILYMCVL